ncbi:MAG: hypothetical protein M1829_000800 [Trizodia sp. TS-e1964]|nr:MAG: hypothetical protein M1829_000800 [Trizodia sp. TS-e1964]
MGTLLPLYEEFIISLAESQSTDIVTNSEDINQNIKHFQSGEYQLVLKSSSAQDLLGLGNVSNGNGLRVSHWGDNITRRIDTIAETPLNPDEAENDPRLLLKNLLVIGISALHAFLQANVTGPPLTFSFGDILCSQEDVCNSKTLEELQKSLLASLTVEGEAAYQLIQNVELFCLAKLIFNHPAICAGEHAARWPRMRVNFLHQRLISVATCSLQTLINEDLKYLEEKVLNSSSPELRMSKVRFLLERAAINTFYGHEVNARQDLNLATQVTDFQFALTGILGKRTKFQEFDTSQLVVLAKSADDERTSPEAINTVEVENTSAKPKNLDLNDDTLLESIAFVKKESVPAVVISELSKLPPTLQALDPSNQPKLKPLDSIILLSFVSSITNTSPADGLTREETLPYAARVLEGGSSNWQIYTQALLVRSRIEGYRSRTVERGVLQLQALVDQVIAETTPDIPSISINQAIEKKTTPTTFLPRPIKSESAPATERLQYIYQLCSPTRWELEAELASRWVSIGALQTALEIYERLQMWAEVAICWGAVDREDRARKLLRRLLFHSSKPPSINWDDEDQAESEGAERDPPPPDAPRLWCILGDMDNDATLYEKAWGVSRGRYARAQRSLGRLYFSKRDFAKSTAAYDKALAINQLNHTTWFALGCAHLELEQWDLAVEAFTRTVQLEGQDAEAWSNLATSLLRKEAIIPAQPAYPPEAPENKEEDSCAEPPPTKPDPSSHPKRAALQALQRASSLAHTNWRIWSNLLTLAGSLRPPSLTDIVAGQKALIRLRGASQGEACIDIDILDLLLRAVITDTGTYDATKPGIARQVVKLIEEDVTPLITTSRRLWIIAAQTAIWRGMWAEALEMHERAWRAAMAGGKGRELEKGEWDDVVAATRELVGAYERLGAKQSGEGVVLKAWRFKARSALRAAIAKAGEAWVDSEGMAELEETLQEVKGQGGA